MSLATALVSPSDAIPFGYVLRYSFTRCLNCGTTTSHSEFYALNFIKSRMNGQPVRHLVPCPAPRYNLHVERINDGHHTIPFCCECDIIDVSWLPDPPSEAKLHDLPETVLRTAPKPPRHTSKPTIGDLA